MSSPIPPRAHPPSPEPAAPQLLELAAGMLDIRHAPARLLSHLCEETCRLFQLERAVALIFEETRGALAVAAAAPAAASPLPGLELPPGHPLLRQLADGRPLLRTALKAPDMPAPELRAVEDLFAAEAIEAAVPLQIETHLLGCLLCGPKRGGGRLTPADIQALAQLCRTAALLLWTHQLEEGFYQNHGLQGLGILAAGLAHELNNPLVSIHTFLALLREANALPPELAEFSAQVRSDLARIKALVEGITSFGALVSRQGEMPVGPVELRQILEDALVFANAELKRARAQVRPAFPARLPPVQGVALLLRQAFSSLIINAAEIIPPGGEIILAANALPPSPTEPQAMVEVEITDTGPGMAPAMIEAIFTPFFSTKAKHRGMGLPIVRQIIRAHQGTIRVRSQPGYGSSFIVRLPAADEA